MTRYFHCLLGSFDKAEATNVIGKLVVAVAGSGYADFQLSQVPAWQTAIQVMDHVRLALLQQHACATCWTLVFEYEIPRRQKRPDVILLADDLIFVIEFKTGARDSPASGRWQARSYALDLSDFHLESRERTIIP